MGLVFTTCTGTRGSGAPIGTGRITAAHPPQMTQLAHLPAPSASFAAVPGSAGRTSIARPDAAGTPRASAAATRVFVLRGLSSALGCGGLTVCGLTFCFLHRREAVRELFSDFDIFQPEWSCSASRTYSRSFLPGRTNVLRPAEKAGAFTDFHRNGPARQAGPTAGPSCREGRMCSDRQRRPARSPIRAGMVLLGKQDLRRSFLPGRTNVLRPAEKAGAFTDSRRNGPARQAGPT